MQPARSKATLGMAEVPSISDLAGLPQCLEIAPLPAQVMVPSASRRLKRDGVEAHVLSSELPRGAFCKLSESLYVSSPELTFVQMGTYLSLHELVALGYEYCGTYALDPLTGQARFELQPVTNPARLRAFVNACSNVKGLQLARRAVAFVCGGSASPMETTLHMRLCLPSRSGGYGLPQALLNHEVRLDGNARRVYKCGSVRFDLFFPKAGLDVEFNGALHEAKMSSDAARDSAVKMMGFESMTVTMAQYRDYLAMGEIVRSIARKHGMYLRKDQVGFTVARAGLYRDLEAYRTGANRR